MSEKETPIGMIPSDWDYSPIGPSIDLLTGPAFDSSRFVDDTSCIRLVRGINVTKGHLRWEPQITLRWPNVTPDLERYHLKAGDIVIGMDGSLVGRNFATITKDDTPSLLVQRVARLRTDHSLCSSFLYYFIASDFWISHVDVVKTHSGIPHISNGDIRNFQITFPPLPEQKKIARILTTVDNLVEKTEALIEKYKAIKQGMMHDLFTRGVDPNGKLRPPYEEAPHLYKESPLGWIPKEWEASSLGELAVFDSGYAFKEHELSEHGWKVVRITNLHRSDFPYWRFDGKPKETWIVKSGDLLFSWAGVASSIDAYLYDGEIALLNQHIYNFRMKSSDEKEFLFNWLQHILPQLRSGIEGGAGQLHLTKDKIQSIAVPHPPDTEKLHLLKIMRTLQHQIKNEKLKVEKLRLHKTGLMQDLLTGMVRVKEAESEELLVNG